MQILKFRFQTKKINFKLQYKKYLNKPLKCSKFQSLVQVKRLKFKLFKLQKNNHQRRNPKKNKKMLNKSKRKKIK